MPDGGYTARKSVTVSENQAKVIKDKYLRDDVPRTF